MSEHDRDRVRQWLTSVARQPLLSLIVIDAEDSRLHGTLRSIGRQLYQRLEIIIVADRERLSTVQRLADAACPWGRFAMVDGTGHGEVSALNAGLDQASGRLVGFVFPGDLLAEAAIAEVIVAIQRYPDAAIIYGDEDWLDPWGSRSRPRFKTGWDPDAQLGFDLLGQLALYDRNMARHVGGLRPSAGPAALYDLGSRLAAEAGPTRIVHVPAILYHRRQPWTADPMETSVAAYSTLAREVARDMVRRIEGHDVEVLGAPLAAWHNRVRWSIPEPPPLVSVLVPTRDRARLLRNCALGILEHTDYPAIELLVLDNGSTETETQALFDELARDPRVRILSMPGPFNYSRLNNDGAAAASGSVLVLLNNDIEITEPGWLRELVSLALRPEIGCVGARLLFADGRIQHAGILLSSGPGAAHIYRRQARDELGHDGQLIGVRSYLAVTGACLAMRKTVFDEIGGLDEARFAVSFNDVDLCLRISDLGYRAVCSPFAEMVHLENASRGPNLGREQVERERRELTALGLRWPDLLERDIYHHPSLRHHWDTGVTLRAPVTGTLTDRISVL